MSILRFLMLLSLVVWVGGIIFLSFVVAPSAFSIVPSRQMAGAVVGRTLSALHWMGIVSGLVFAATSMIYSHASTGSAQPFAARHILIYAMIALTLVSQLGISAKLVDLRAQMVQVESVPQDDPRRVQFNRLHQWSTRLEGTVLLLGLAVLYLTARKLG
jgi:uncharacterized membrane protein